jgi:sigma-E factor negative regulatory protein RseA
MQISHHSLSGSNESAAPVYASPEGVPLREQLSALADGETGWVNWNLLHVGYAGSAEVQHAWSDYCLIRDALHEPAHCGSSASDDFVARVMAQVAREAQRPVVMPVVETPNKMARVAKPANDPVFRWKMVAGLASVAAVSAVAWQLVASPMAPSGPQLAGAPVATDPVQLVVTPSGNVMMRDAQLDELMAAHRQWGGVSALQMPAGFIRNATYEPAQR